MKAAKAFNIFMIILFVIAIATPLIMVNKMQGKVSVSENRTLAGFPDITSGDGGINANLIEEFESWFNDNMGFRDELVKANSTVQYSLFGKLTRTDTVIGKDNWLYLMYPNMLRAYQNLDLPTQDEYSQYNLKFSQLSDYLTGMGIPFITMVNPDKETIYPEYMPDNILKVGGDSRTDLVVDYLGENTNVDIFSTKESLLKAKEHDVVYSQNYDLSHWNSNGAFVAYSDLMNRVKKYIPDIKVLNKSDFIIEPYVRKSNSVLQMEETDFKWTYKESYNAVENRGGIDNLNLSSNSISFRYVNPNNDNLPKALILGDSYIYMFMLPNLAESFSELTFIHWENAEELKNYVNVTNPDVFILEFMEPALHEFTKSISYPGGYFDNYNQYEDLQVHEKQKEGLMWLDSVNGSLISGDTITLDKSEKIIKLEGWAVDSDVGDTAEQVFLKVGNKYYSGSYGAPKTSVSDYFSNSKLTNSGFTFYVNVEDLKDTDKIGFVIISKDKSYQYAPINYKIVWE